MKKTDYIPGSYIDTLANSLKNPKEDKLFLSHIPKKLKFSKPRKVEKKKSYWKRKCDILFSKFIRSLDHCEKCGATKTLQIAHVYSRRYLNLRYNIQNVLCLCAKCHLTVWHQSPLEAMMWFNQAYPERVKYLIKEKQKIKKFKIEDYKKIIKELENYTWQKK